MRASLPYRFSRSARAPRSLPWLSGLALWLWLCSPALAFEVFDAFQIHGFLSQAYILTTNNNFFGSSERGGSLDFTEIGVNASWTPLPRLQFAAQPLFRHAGAGHESDFELDFALMDYAVLSTADRRLGFRLGRIKNPLGLYNDTRDVAFTRPSILLPESIYLDNLREPFVSGDGAHVYGELRSRWGDFFLEFGGISPRADDLDTELAIFLQDFPGRFKNELTYLGRLTYQLDGGRYKLAVSGAQLNLSYEPRFLPPQDLQAGSDQFELLILSAQYNGERWSFTGEYALRHTEDQGFGPDFPDTAFTGESYYLQAMYRASPKWEAFLRYDVFYANRDDRNGAKFEALTGIPGHNLFAKDWTIGARYYVTPALMVAAEYHHVYGAGWLPRQDNPDLTATDKKWDLFALLVSYRF
ncbi:MAG: porin [Gammaproteobacteria bacterium]